MSVFDTGDRPTLVILTPEVCEDIYRVLVAHADAKPEQRLAFIHQMSETGTGLGQTEWRLNSGYYGPTCFFRCGDEWIVTTTHEDLTPATQTKLDDTNLELAILRDSLLPPI